MQQSQKTDASFHSYPWWPWSSILVLAGLGLVMALIGTYTFRWTWTGFYGNTLWDWLQVVLRK